MRSRFAYVAVLALTIALLVPSTAIAAETQSTVDVAAARVAAEHQLISRGIDPGTAVFQIGARNYAGPDCPGSGWNCTSAAIIVQIATGVASSSINKVEQCSDNPCTITQDNAGGKNEARCVQRTSENPQVQRCVITQTNTTGTNKAFVSQSIKQTQPDESQDARQLAAVIQTNGAGTNDSQINQAIEQREASELNGPAIVQTQEAHQRADVCQGGDPCRFAPTGEPSMGKNVSDVSQSNAQRLKVHFSGDSFGAITQNQNMSGADPTSLAVVDQKSTESTNDSRLEQSSRQIASAQDGKKDKDEDNDEELSRPSPFFGTVNQQQGVDGNPDCPDSGLCGFVTQDSTGVQRARERQDELQKLQGPPGPNTTQTQYGPVFCCATQTGSPINPRNKNDINQVKVQLHTSSIAEGKIQGHCDSSPNGCNVNQRLRQNDTRQSNSCSDSPCNPTIVCFSGPPSEEGPPNGCTPGTAEGPLPPPPCSPLLCSDAPNRVGMIAPLRFAERHANL